MTKSQCRRRNELANSLFAQFIIILSAIHAVSLPNSVAASGSLPRIQHTADRMLARRVVVGSGITDGSRNLSKIVPADRLFAVASLKKLRGGSDVHHTDLDEDELILTTSEPAHITKEDDLNEAEKIDADEFRDDNEQLDGFDDTSNDDMEYMTIGIMNIGSTGHGSGATGALQHEDKILLRHRQDRSNCVNNWWGLHDSSTSDNETADRKAQDDVKSVATAEVMGCLCHSFVLNLLSSPDDILGSNELDNILLSVAGGMTRRIKSMYKNIRLDVEIPIAIAFGNAFNGNDASVKAEIHRYIQQFLDRALALSIRRHFGKEHLVSVPRWRITVSSSEKSATETALEMTERDLAKQNEECDANANLVPQSLFGTLATRMIRDICNRLLSLHNIQIEGSQPTWEIISDDSCETICESEKMSCDEDRRFEDKSDESSKDPSQSTHSQPVSDFFQLMVQGMMAREFVNAEESLMELETKMDRAILDGYGNEAPMPEFGSDADAILDAISESFSKLMDEASPITEADRKWAESQRIEALSQVAGHTLNRLFHLYLQSIRDYFGRQYENILDDPIAAGLVVDDEGDSINQNEWDIRRRDAAKKAEEGFIKAAFGSIPQICRLPDGELCGELAGLYGCTDALRGLLEDMFEATSTRGLDEEEMKDIMDVSSDDVTPHPGDLEASSKRVGLRQLIKNIKAKRQKRGPAKWYERFAGKALMIAVNYIQGWLVLQALRREARRRDLVMPKFPLF